MIQFPSSRLFLYVIYTQNNNINCKKLRSQFPYNCVHTLIFLLNVMMAYQGKTCCWINTGIKTVVFDPAITVIFITHNRPGLNCLRILQMRIAQIKSEIRKHLLTVSLTQPRQNTTAVLRLYADIILHTN